MCALEFRCLDDVVPLVGPQCPCRHAACCVVTGVEVGQSLPEDGRDEDTTWYLPESKLSLLDLLVNSRGRRTAGYSTEVACEPEESE